MRNNQKFLKSKGLWVLFVGFFGVFGIGYILFFTSRFELKVQSAPNSVRIIGDPASYQRSVHSSGIAGSKELCWTPPECEKIVGTKEKEGREPIELDRLSDIEKKCLFECLPPPDSPWAGERETVTLSLTGDQVTQLIAVHLPQNYKIKNLTVDISGETLYFQGVSSYLLLPGEITGELLRENHRYELRDLYAGRVPVPQRVQTYIERNLDSIIIDSLAAYGVSLSGIKIENDRLIVTVETPKGLVHKKADIVVINFEILPTPAPTKPEEDIRIQ